MPFLPPSGTSKCDVHFAASRIWINGVEIGNIHSMELTDRTGDVAVLRLEVYPTSMAAGPPPPTPPVTDHYKPELDRKVRKKPAQRRGVPRYIEKGTELD